MNRTGCLNCTLHADTDYEICLHPDADGQIPEAAKGGAPAWCPLRKGPLTVSLDPSTPLPATRTASGWIMRDYRCRSCGERVEHLLGRAESPPACACGGELEPLISAVRGRVKLGEVTRGKNGPPPPNALDTRPLADGMRYSEWREQQKSRRRDEIHRLSKEM